MTPMGISLDPIPSMPIGASSAVVTRNRRSAAAAAEDLVWLGDGVLPNDGEIARAIEVMSTVPLAGALGWSVRGNPWSRHPQRLRPAVIAPGPDWDITVLRGVREVDSLSGRLLVRRPHLERSHGEWRSETDGAVAHQGADSRVDATAVSRLLRGSGFRLLLMSDT